MNQKIPHASKNAVAQIAWGRTAPQAAINATCPDRHADTHHWLIGCGGGASGRRPMERSFLQQYRTNETAFKFTGQDGIPGSQQLRK
jgi:hypothetical protein